MAHVEKVIAAARGCVGARFRPHGRSVATGLDCVGVAAMAFGRQVEGDYPLRLADLDAVVRRIDRTGLQPIMPALSAAGSLILTRAPAGQLHLAVLTERGFVHADALLRRVVETPGLPGDPIVAAWQEED